MLLSTFPEDGTPLVMFGDFNIHIIKPQAADIHTLLASFDLKRVLTTATHKSGNQLIYTRHCSTDHVLVTPLHTSDYFLLTLNLNMVPDTTHTHSMCYADDTQLYISTRPEETSKLSKLTECVKNVKDWMTNNFLLLNSDKTEILLIRPKNRTQNLLDYNLQLDGCPVTSSTVKNLGVILDSNLSFEKHISNVTKSAFFHLRNIAKLFLL